MRTFRFIILFSIAGYIASFAQNVIDYRVMSYNVENLFDTKHDSLKNDNEYLPGGIRNWNYIRYQAKIYHIGQVVSAIGEWNPPVLIGLYEIENRHVLNDLVNGPLQNLNYSIAHFPSPDLRGIDVGVLYNSDVFHLLKAEPHSINFPENPVHKTRDILYICGTMPSGDTLHVFANHFPSRYRGELESEDSRIFVASVLRNLVDSILSQNSSAEILIMGDFNDYPDNNSIRHILRALPSDSTMVYVDSALYNLTYKLNAEGKIGSYKHDGNWGMLDQLIVSGSLMNDSKKLQVKRSSINIFHPSWLLENDKSLGKKPKRTYVGMKYNEGYSDHLPVYLDLVWQKK